MLLAACIADLVRITSAWPVVSIFNFYYWPATWTSNHLGMYMTHCNPGSFLHEGRGSGVCYIWPRSKWTTLPSVTQQLLGSALLSIISFANKLISTSQWPSRLYNMADTCLENCFIYKLASIKENWPDTGVIRGSNSWQQTDRTSIWYQYHCI